MLDQASRCRPRISSGASTGTSRPASARPRQAAESSILHSAAEIHPAVLQQRGQEPPLITAFESTIECSIHTVPIASASPMRNLPYCPGHDDRGSGVTFLA